MANSNADAYLLFDVDTGTGDNIYQSLKGILNTVEQKLNAEGSTKLKFSVDEGSLNEIKQRISNIGNSNKNAILQKEYLANFGSQLQNYQNTILKFKNLPVNGNNTSFSDINATVESMQSVFNNAGGKYTDAERYKELIRLSGQYKTQLASLNAQLRNYNAESASSTKMLNLQKEVGNIWDKHKGSIIENKEALKKYNEVQAKLKLGLGTEGGYANAQEASVAVAKLKKELSGMGALTDGLSTRMRKLFGVHIKTALTMSGIHALRQGFSQLVKNVKEIDSALTQLKIVSGESGAAIEKFADKAFQAASKIGSSAVDIMKSTETWSRLGYSLDDSLSLASTTAKFSNVGSISVEDATTSMTAILKAFSTDEQNAPEMAQKIADILTVVGKKYAISASELGEGLKAGGASLEAANNTLEQSVALLAAGNAAVQDSSKVGNALKTTTLRIRGATAELEDSGEEIDSFCESTSKMQATIKGLSGVDIMEADNKTFRSTYDIMLDISKVWDKLTDINQASLLEALSGKRNATVIKSIITNVKDLEGAYADASNAAGIVDEANSKYIDSIEGKLNQFTTKFQEFSESVSNTEWIKGIIAAGTGLVEVLKNILTFGNGAVGTIGMIAAGFALFSKLKIGKILPPMPECKSNGRVCKLVNCWEVWNEYYDYKAA